MKLSQSEEQRLIERERNYWWHVSKRRFLSSVLKKFKILLHQDLYWALDIGSAAGAIKDIFPSKQTRLILADTSIHKSFQTSSHPYKVVCVAQHLPFRSNSLQLVIAADVLEHIEDPKNAVNEIYRILTPGSSFLATVPAYQFLFSVHDEALGHFRRYTGKLLNQTLKEGGFEILFSSGIFITLLPAIFLRRLISPLGSKVPRSSYVEVPKWINRLCVQWFSIEAILFRIIRFPLGSSILSLGKKT